MVKSTQKRETTEAALQLRLAVKRYATLRLSGLITETGVNESSYTVTSLILAEIAEAMDEVYKNK